MSDFVDSWIRSLRAANRSTSTLSSYGGDLARFETHLGRDPLDATRVDVEAFLVATRDAGLSEGTAARRYRALQQFFRWAEEEDEIARSPMARMRPPTVTDTPPNIIGEADYEKLLEACRGERINGDKRRTRTNGAIKGRSFDFEARRDEALLRLLWDSGVRAGEIMGMTVDDVDFTNELFTVIGKGNRLRKVALLPKPAESIDRYLRARRRHPSHSKPWLWLGRQGRFTDTGLRQMLDRRAADAGLDHLHPHQFRHSFAHRAKVLGMADEALMQVAGWQSPQMLARYGRAAAADRARDQHRKLMGGVS